MYGVSQADVSDFELEAGQSRRMYEEEAFAFPSMAYGRTSIQ